MQVAAHRAAVEKQKAEDIASTGNGVTPGKLNQDAPAYEVSAF